MNLQEAIDYFRDWRAEKNDGGPANSQRQEKYFVHNINATIHNEGASYCDADTDGAGVRLATLSDMQPSHADQVARLMAAAPAMAEFTIQVLYSLTGECKAHHCAAPYQPEELADQARAILAQLEPDGE